MQAMCFTSLKSLWSLLLAVNFYDYFQWIFFSTLSTVDWCTFPMRVQFYYYLHHLSSKIWSFPSDLLTILKFYLTCLYSKISLEIVCNWWNPCGDHWNNKYEICFLWINYSAVTAYWLNKWVISGSRVLLGL